MPYPVGPAYQLLALSGLRLNEAAQARWSEIDIKKREWVIGADRMKGTDEGAREHLVPLTDAMLKILDSVPRIEGSDFVFTWTGKKPLQLGSKHKRELDKLMLAELRAADPKAKLAHWQNHDLRRSCRSTLAALGVSTTVGELVLAHKQGGVAAVYNRHDYRSEKLDALEKWNGYLIGLAGREPEPANVVKLRRRSA